MSEGPNRRRGDPRKRSSARNSRTDRGAGPDALVEARIRVRVPKPFPWRAFTEQNPDVVLESRHRSLAPPDRIVAEVRIRSEKERDWSAELRSLPNVVSVDSLAKTGQPGAYRVRWRAPAFYPRLLDKFDLIGLVPFELSQGYVSLSLAVSNSKLRQLVKELKRREFAPEVIRVRPFSSRPSHGGLTAKQLIRFRAAVEDGYFEVPRRTTLDALARRFSVRKASYAESLAHARRKILLAAGEVVMNAAEIGQFGLLPAP
jgi:predicted DNA binding protein